MHQEWVPQCEARNYFRMVEVLLSTPSEFTYMELLRSLVAAGMGESTAKRKIPRLVEIKLLRKDENRYRVVWKKWFRKQSREGSSVYSDTTDTATHLRSLTLRYIVVYIHASRCFFNAP